MDLRLVKNVTILPSKKRKRANNDGKYDFPDHCGDEWCVALFVVTSFMFYYYFG